jgi:dTDP-4-amino-4,6-dideoxygalactose transaminase
MSQNPIYVVKPSLPPFEEYTAQIQKIWDTHILTNNGPLHGELEARLRDHLGLGHIVLFNNATNALIAALGVLDLKGEIITTPFSFIATSHSILWNGLTPIFVDVDPATLNIDPSKIESAITDKTSAIMAVHCYGHPCDVDVIGGIAQKHNLKVIYDAAHAFGVECHCGSILTHGDLSVLSFHATKVFNTFEGGAIVCKDAAMKTKIEQFKNFGIVDETHIEQTGMNGKMSEAHAALGLAMLPHMQNLRTQRQKIDALYRSELSTIKGLMCLEDNAEKSNYAYFPVRVQKEFKLTRDALYEALKKYNIFTRRYFYPLLSDFPMYKNFPSAAPENLPSAHSAAKEILCLPIYPDLTEADQMRVINAIKELS